jgi:hypothetical protein
MNITQLLKRKEVCEERISRINSEIWDRYCSHFIKRGYGSLKDVTMEGGYVVITTSHRGDNYSQCLIHKSFFEIENVREAEELFRHSKQTKLKDRSFSFSWEVIQYDPWQ